MKVYVINLDRHPERLAHMRRQLEGVPFERAPAVDGLNGAPTARGLSRFELACLASHQNAWRQVLNGAEDFVCILEDDLHVQPDFAEVIRDDAWIPRDAHSVKLDTYFQNVKLGERRKIPSGREIARLYTRHESAAAYVLTRAGAERCLEISAAAKLPADYCVFPTNPRRLGLTIYQLIPAVAIQDHLLEAAEGGRTFATAISNSRWKRSRIEKLQRETVRLAFHGVDLLEAVYLRATVNPEKTTVGVR